MSVAVAAPIADQEVLQIQAMIDAQLRPNNVIDPTILKAVANVARGRFVAPTHAAMAYSDRAVPLAAGRALNPALTTVRLIADAEVVPGMKVLLIGAASGYAAALLSQLGASVVAVESDAALVAMARMALQNDAHVTVVEGDLAKGASEHAPFDLLIVDGAVEQLPESLLAQVKDGGRVVAGQLDRGITRLTRAVHISGSPTHPYAFADLECVTLPGFAPVAGFTF